MEEKTSKDKLTEFLEFLKQDATGKPKPLDKLKPLDIETVRKLKKEWEVKQRAMENSASPSASHVNSTRRCNSGN